MIGAAVPLVELAKHVKAVLPIVGGLQAVLMAADDHSYHCAQRPCACLMVSDWPSPLAAARKLSI
jgi:hypothetical protein